MSKRTRYTKQQPRPFGSSVLPEVVDYQRSCTVCEAAIRWISWDHALKIYGGEWLYEQRQMLYGMMGEDLVSIDVWSCTRHGKHYGLTVAGAATWS